MRATDNLPQIYWKAIGDTVREAFGVTYLYNRIYERPDLPGRARPTRTRRPAS